MTARLVRVVMASLLALTCVMTGTPPAAEATIGPYTLPFFYPHSITQPYGCTDLQVEGPIPPGQSCPVHNPPMKWHSGIDFGMPIGTEVVSSNSGTSSAWVDSVADGNQTGAANYFYLKHGTNLYSLYYHLKYHGVIFKTIGTPISAGQKIAFSGDTGAYGQAHLHYELDTQNVIGCNPAPSFCDLNPNQWTTSPGRVPWHGKFEGQESYPYGYTGFVGVITTVWVKFRNDGGRTWSVTDPTNGNGHVFLAAVTSAGNVGRNSAFYVSGDWESANTPGRADQATVAPDSVATFTWGMLGPGVGSYNNLERFNLGASGLFWFDYYGNPGISGYLITPITIQHCCAPI
jgi:hypothetical protein